MGVTDERPLPRVLLDWSAVVAIVGGVVAFSVTSEKTRANEARIARVESRLEHVADDLASKDDIRRVESRLDALYQLQLRGNRP